MYKKFITFICVYVLTIQLFAQEKPEVLKAEGEWQVQWYQEKESKQEAKNRAEERAKVVALEKAFGTVIVQGNTTYIKNVSTGKQTETQTTFNMIGNTIVGGEIIQVLNKEFKENTQKYRRRGEKVEDIFITCEITVLARKTNDKKIHFQANLLSGDMINNKTTDFYDGNDIYFHFRSPVSGYVSLYVDITGQGITQRLLPYQNTPVEFEGGMPVEADKDYIFFSKAKNESYYPDKGVVVDEIFAGPEKDREVWRFFTIFSKEPINKPSLKEGKTGLTKKDRENNITVPKELKSEDFQRWMIRNMHLREDFQRKVIDAVVMKR